jgi:hypothetical protein
MIVQRYKFQGLLTLGTAGSGDPVAAPPGQLRRVVVRGEHHQTHGSRIFSALITNNGDGSRWLNSGHAIVTVVLVGEDPGDYFHVGGHFTLWQGSDVGHGVVTRRLFV